VRVPDLVLALVDAEPFLARRALPLGRRREAREVDGGCRHLLLDQEGNHAEPGGDDGRRDGVLHAGRLRGITGIIGRSRVPVDSTPDILL